MNTRMMMGSLAAIGLCVAGFQASAAEVAVPGETALGQRMTDQATSRAKWYIEPYRPNYVLPLTYIDGPSEKLAAEEGVDPDEFDDVEVKFQVSFRLGVLKDKLPADGDLYFAYTQVSVWQAYNSDHSSPFRDTNYEPEFFAAFDTDYDLFGLHGRMLSIGAVHQSNGRGDEALSRSWNRIYAQAVLERGGFACSVKPWYRIPESEDEDNNPDIADYMGYGEFRAAYKLREHVFSTMLRNNFQTEENHGAIELGWSFPMTKAFKGYVQYFNGYAETLLDYNERDQRIGVGFLLSDWL